MKNSILLEIGIEELPSQYVKEILAGFKTVAEKSFSENRISYNSLQTFSSPRRLVLKVEGVSEFQQSETLKFKGPSKVASFDEYGNPTKALLGFLNGKNKTFNDITIEDVSGSSYVFVLVNSETKTTESILPEILKQIILNIPMPRSMRWGSSDFKFIRPIRWLVALFNENVINFDINGIKSDRKTKGHRTLANKIFVLKSADEYDEVMKKAFVLYKETDRASAIKKQILNIELDNNVTVEIPKKLFEEVCNLVEYPTADLGTFNQKYLKLPNEVVITPMRDHQRYFPVYQKGKLCNKFVYVRNGDDFSIQTVRNGNERVLVARLDDAEFFFNEDLKTSLNTHAKNLNEIVFRDGLGTMQDKQNRIQQIALKLANLVNYYNLENIILASQLCKADLLTNMVKEFEELQGVMGREYGKLELMPEEVTVAIGSHYKPNFAGDDLPNNILGSILSFADKLDSVVGSFAINVVPTGSADPFGIRRQAIAIISILQKEKWNFDLFIFISSLESIYLPLCKDKNYISKVTDFFVQRLKTMMLEKYDYDVVNAVLSGNSKGEILNLSKILEEIKNFKSSENEKILEALNRIKKLVTKTNCNNTVDVNLFTNFAENSLYNEYLHLNQDFKVVNVYNMKEYLRSLNKLTEKINSFFDNVLVMDKNENIKNNRLALLNLVLELSTKIADITNLQVKGEN